jgi:hypothetical protein
MKPIRCLSSILLAIFLVLSGMIVKGHAMAKGVEVPRVTKEQLLSMTGKPEVVILDVRESESWEKSKQKIRGAVREDPEKESPEFPFYSKKRQSRLSPAFWSLLISFWFFLIQPLSQLPQGDNREAHQNQSGRFWSL